MMKLALSFLAVVLTILSTSSSPAVAGKKKCTKPAKAFAHLTKKQRKAQKDSIRRYLRLVRYWHKQIRRLPKPALNCTHLARWFCAADRLTAKAHGIKPHKAKCKAALKEAKALTRTADTVRCQKGFAALVDNIERLPQYLDKPKRAQPGWCSIGIAAMLSSAADW